MCYFHPTRLSRMRLMNHILAPGCMSLISKIRICKFSIFFQMGESVFAIFEPQHPLQQLVTNLSAQFASEITMDILHSIRFLFPERHTLLHICTLPETNIAWKKKGRPQMRIPRLNLLLPMFLLPLSKFQHPPILYRL